MSLKHKILNTIPASCRQRLRKAYYPWMLRHFDESRWPPARWVKTLINEGDVVVDVGANIGYVSMLLSRYAGASGRVYSMEPVPETYGYLAHNIHKLNLNNVISYNVALSSEPGVMWMDIPEYDDGGMNFYEARLVHKSEAKDAVVNDGKRRVQVRVATLDELLVGPVGQIDFMKIDVEGHEWEVIQGAEKLIKNSRPVLLIEVEENPDLAGSNAQQLFHWLRRFNYQPYCITGNELVPRTEGCISGDYFFLPKP